MGNIYSPFYLLGPPLLLVVSVPLAICAIFTTAIAITALAAHASIAYFELAMALIHACIFPPPPKAVPPRQLSRRASPNHTRSRGSSIASSASSRDTVIPSQPARLPNKSASFVSLIGTSEITRDFEGVGGWRLSNGDAEEALWIGMNSRLELPAVPPKRNHRRSLTGGSLGQRWSWSPVPSRPRTPNYYEEKHAGEGYFPLQSSPSNVRPLSLQEARRKSASASSTSSGASNSRRTSVAFKEPGD